MYTNVHEWLWAGGEEPRNTRNTRKNSGITNGHEWTRMAMGRGGRNHETHEIHEKTQEPRMDTNGHECQGRAFVSVKVRLLFKLPYPIGKGC